MASRRPGSGARLFAVFAVLSLLPVLVLGTVLSLQFRAEVEQRGRVEGLAQAATQSRLLSETVLDGHTLAEPMNDVELIQLRAFVATEIRNGQIARIRVRGPNGTIVYSNDGTVETSAHDDGGGTETGPREAAAGRSVVELTRLDGDENGDAAEGQNVVEVYTPIHSRTDTSVIGVLEVYLPYGPIQQQMNRGLNRLSWTLVSGLGLLYVVLASLAWVTTRRLGRQAKLFQHLALHDPLTNLPNRARFSERISEAITAAKRTGRGSAVVLLDVDKFRGVNDTLGHHNGDALLSCLADRLTTHVGSDDTVARLGGDEFGLVLAGVHHPDEAAPLLARIQAAVEEEVDLAGVSVSVEASMGVVFVPKDGETADRALQHADVALEVAKRTHAGISYYEAAQNDYNAEKLALVAELRRALERDELVLHYQPQIRQPDGEVIAVEALVRWQHPTRGLLFPDAFVPAAELTGLIEPMTRWILDAAIAQLQAWQDVAPDLMVAVNISARSLQRPEFPELVLDALEQADCPPNRVILEITETALVTDAPVAAQVLNRLKAANIKLSLDDFGQGYTSLSQLPNLPISELKIDKAFVMRMLRSNSDAAIVRSVIELAHNLGMRVVAEGVEDSQTLDALRELNCDVTQGYLFSKPLDPEKLVPWMLRHAAGQRVAQQAARHAHQQALQEAAERAAQSLAPQSLAGHDLGDADELWAVRSGLRNLG
jgi:diguanylate cyclase (GGDEF)-like protein